MNFAAEILVIILSVTLTIFLIFATILAVYIINLTRQIRKVTDAAERTVDNIESAVSRAVRASFPVMFAAMITKIFKKIKKDKEEK